MVACYEKKGASCEVGVGGLQDVQKVFVQGDSYGLHGGFQFVFGEVARPDDYYLPAGIHQFVVNPCIPSSIPFYLVLPESGVGLWQDELLATLVTVPETTVDEDSRSVFAHDDIRLARHTLDVQPVSISMCPQPFPHRYFRLGRFAAYIRHAAMALCRCQDIGHNTNLIGLNPDRRRWCL